MEEFWLQLIMYIGISVISLAGLAFLFYVGWRLYVHYLYESSKLSMAIRNGRSASRVDSKSLGSGGGGRAPWSGSVTSISSVGSGGSRSIAPLIQGNQRLPDLPIPERRPSARYTSITPSQIQSECYSDDPTVAGSPDSETIPSTACKDDQSRDSIDVSLGHLHFSVAYEAQRLALIVTVLKATELPVRHLDSSNPYVKLQLLPEKRQKAKTRVVRRSVNPVYDETFTFYSVEPEQLKDVAATTGSRLPPAASAGGGTSPWAGGLTLHLAVLSFDSFARDDLVGEVIYPLYEAELLERSGKPVDVVRALCSRTSNKLMGLSSVRDRGELLISLCYQPAADRLTVIVLKAKNLPRMDITGLSDPYVKVYLTYNGQRVAKKKTHVKKRTLNPVFNESFAFDLPASSCGGAGDDVLHGIRLEFVVYDWDRVTRNEVIGRVEIGDRVREAEGHWNEVVNCPRKQIAEWHHLKP